MAACSRHRSMSALLALSFLCMSWTIAHAQLESLKDGFRQRSTLADAGKQWPAHVPERLKPVMLHGQGPTPGEQQPSSDSSPTYKFHWVITTCSTRVKWGRMLTTTLLSGILNGLQPVSISIAYCRPYDPKTLPALLFNLKNSRYVNIFFPPTPTTKPKYPKFYPYWIATETVLLAPTMLGAPDVPLLMTEDDIIFAPDAHVRIEKAAKQAIEMSQGQPYFLNLYWHDTTMKIEANATTLPQDIAPPDADIQIKRRSRSGFQGAIFSPGMTEIFLKRFTDLLSADKVDPHDVAYSDYIVREDIHNGFLGCNKPGSNCHAFVVEPSIVQHAGTSSTTHPGKRNSSFHMANSFPVKVAFAGFENDTMWRK